MQPSTAWEGRSMKRWVLLGYLVVEIAAFWAMVHFLGWGWAFLITIAAAGIGFAVLGRRARQLFAPRSEPVSTLSTAPESRDAMTGRLAGAVSDSALFAGATVLTVLPGVVTTVGGLVLLSPPVRRLLRPVVAAEATKRANLVAERVTLVGMSPRGYVDGTVVEGTSGRAEGVVVETTVRNPDGTIVVDVPVLPPAEDRPGSQRPQD